MEIKKRFEDKPRGYKTWIKYTESIRKSEVREKPLMRTKINEIKTGDNNLNHNVCVKP